MKNAPQIDRTALETTARHEIVKQALEYSRHPPWAEPFAMDERGRVTSGRQDEVHAFLWQLEQWGYIVVSKFDPRLAGSATASSE